MTDTAGKFRPFEDFIDEGETLSFLRKVSNGADFCELFLERSRSEDMIFDDRHLKSSSYGSHQGFGLRVARGEVTGYAHASQISKAAIMQAADTVRSAVRDGTGGLQPSPHVFSKRYYSGTDPIAQTGFSEKLSSLERLDQYARELDGRIVQVSAGISTSFQEVEILHVDGQRAVDARPMSQLRVQVIVEQSGHRETGFAATGGRYVATGLLDSSVWQPVVAEALRIALVNLDSVPTPAGVMDVVLGPGWPGVLLHEAVGHGLEGDFNRKETSAFSGLMGQRVAAKGVHVVDDGTIPDRRGSISFDDEGTPSQRNVLIEDGVLIGYMQDRQNGKLMGTGTTGNCRRQSCAHPPMPRMTNTFMLSGEDDPMDILSDLKDGIYAPGFSGGQVDITNGKFVFSCTEAYRVQNGTIGAPLKNATLIGDGASALKSVRAIGNDLALDPGVGVCGKDGQWVPVGVGLPTVMIGGLTVGGSAA